jgi:hypothetical protein
MQQLTAISDLLILAAPVNSVAYLLDILLFGCHRWMISLLVAKYFGINLDV